MKLFYYEHCPFCVRVLMLVNYKNIELECIVLANDDEETPIAMTGKKMLPTLQKNKGEYLPESLDILHYLDQLNNPVLPEHYTPQAVTNWLTKAKPILRVLTYPRMILHPFKEFETQSSRDYFENKKSKSIGPFDDAISKTAELVQELKPLLEELNDYVLDSNKDKLSWEDIHLFPYVLSLTLVPGIEWPTALRQYLDTKCQLFKINAYQTVA